MPVAHSKLAQFIEPICNSNWTVQSDDSCSIEVTASLYGPFSFESTTTHTSEEPSETESSSYPYMFYFRRERRGSHSPIQPKLGTQLEGSEPWTNRSFDYSPLASFLSFRITGLQCQGLDLRRFQKTCSVTRYLRGIVYEPGCFVLNTLRALRVMKARTEPLIIYMLAERK